MPAINKSTLAALTGIAAFAGLVLGCIGGGIGGYQIRKSQDDRATTGGRPPEPERPSGPMSRKAFEAAVMGKTHDQIIAAVGRPDDTRERVPGGSFNQGPGVRMTFVFDWWVYRNRVQNDATGRPYPAVAVRFGMDGRADLLEYP